MTTPATPTPRKKYKRPTKFPARLSTMLRQDQREEIDLRIEGADDSLGEVTRDLLDKGIDLDLAYKRDVLLEADVVHMANEADVPVAEALATMLRFAVHESAKRRHRPREVTLDI